MYLVQKITFYTYEIEYKGVVERGKYEQEETRAIRNYSNGTN